MTAAMHPIAIVSPLGGCGRTTLTAHLATLLAQRGRPCLAIDLCAQNMLGRHLGMQPSAAPGWAALAAERQWWGQAALSNSDAVDLLPFGAASTAALDALQREWALTPEWLRILVHSGLSDGLIPNRYFAMVREKLFPRLLRETRRAAGSRSKAAATPREEAALMAFHGGLIYHLGIWPLVYQQHFTGQGDAAMVDQFIADRISGLLAQAADFVPTRGTR